MAKETTTAPKKRGGKKPSERMKKAASLLVEKGSEMSKAQIMKEAWYSAAIQVAPSKVIESPTFKQLLDEFIPEKDLAAKHKQLLEASDTFGREFPNETPDDDIHMLCQPHTVVKVYRDVVTAKNPLPHTVAYLRAIDRKTAKEALDMGYKLRGSYAPVKTESKVLDLTWLLEAALGRSNDQ